MTQRKKERKIGTPLRFAIALTQTAEHTQTVLCSTNLLKWRVNFTPWSPDRLRGCCHGNGPKPGKQADPGQERKVQATGWGPLEKTTAEKVPENGGLVVGSAGSGEGEGKSKFINGLSPIHTPLHNRVYWPSWWQAEK